MLIHEQITLFHCSDVSQSYNRIEIFESNAVAVPVAFDVPEQGLKAHMPISVIVRALQRSGHIVRLRAKKLGLIE